MNAHDQLQTIFSSYTIARCWGDDDIATFGGDETAPSACLVDVKRAAATDDMHQYDAWVAHAEFISGNGGP